MPHPSLPPRDNWKQARNLRERSTPPASENNASALSELMIRELQSRGLPSNPQTFDMLSKDPLTLQMLQQAMAEHWMQGERPGYPYSTTPVEDESDEVELTPESPILYLNYLRTK